MSYDAGDQVVLTGGFTLVNGGAAADPTTITLAVRDPGGVITTYTGGGLTRAATGVYTLALRPIAAGTWRYQWFGTGAVVATSPVAAFVVLKPLITPPT